MLTAGATVDDARAEAVEALRFHIERLVEDGIAIPQPSSLLTVLARPETTGAVAFSVDLSL